MDKLISANAVITILENARFRAGKDLSKAYLIADLQEQIERLPAAFDKEKVMEELDECKQIMLSPTNKDCFGEECRENDCLACVFNKAIEIVEKGGVE